MKAHWRNGLFLMALAVSLLITACTRLTQQGTAPAAPPVVFQGKPSSTIVFLSTQLNPVEEADSMRNVILKDFPGAVDFRPNNNNFIFSQSDAILKRNPSTPVLLGALHGDLVRLYQQGALRPLDDLYAGLQERGFSQGLLDLSRLGGRGIYYIPWMQASFVMAANKKALAYLPEGANLNELTYAQLLQWATAIHARTGKKALGFPAGTKGLMHRFFQGYLYPSFTASTLLKFRGADARTLWAYFKELWQVVNPDSLVYSTMAEPLLTQDVWIAWDHTARLRKALEEKPNDFVVFPAPVGPKGRGFMAVISGLAIPARVTDVKDAAFLIDYLTLPVIQDRTMRATGFFPVLSPESAAGSPAPLQGLQTAVRLQANSPNAILTLPPVGLGSRGADYDSLFLLTFSEIVLGGRGIQAVLDENAGELQKIIDSENARAWLPDRSPERPCKIE